MKKFFNGMIALAIAGTVLFGCQADNVAPQEGRAGGPSIAGAASDPHPRLDTLCQTSDTLWMFREDNGSPIVDKCFGAGGVPVACNPATPMKWGGLVINEGYLANENYLDCNFWMAAGWFCNFNNWEFGLTNSFTFDQNGIPVVTNDWSNLVVNPVANKWQLRLAVDSLPTGEFDLALRVGAIKLNLFGATVAGSATTLWGRNSNWNTTGDKAASNSQWVMHFSPARCLDVQLPPAPDTTSICEVVYTGLTCTGNNLASTVLHPTATETGVVTYAWSNGATTQDITVSPTVTTPYSVTISVDGVPTHVVIFNVNVIDVSCAITQGGGNGGGGNGGSGSGGSGSGSGGSGGHNHGCNSQHGGGSNSCNHRGHGRHCSGTHATNRSCNGGHTRGCSGNHSNNQTCQSGGGHRNNCTGQHNGNTCTTGLQHAQGCNGNHHAYRGCATNNNGSGGSGSGGGGGSGSGGNYGSGSGNGGNGGGSTTIPGVKVCHVPPGNPGGATTVCVPYGQLAQHVTGVCPSTNNGGGNGGNGGSGSGSGSGGSGSGQGWGNGGSGSGSGSGGGNGHGCGGHTNNCNGHHQGGNCNNGHSGSGGSGSGSNANGHGSHHGGGCQGNQGGGHIGDMIGACNSNLCL